MSFPTAPSMGRAILSLSSLATQAKTSSTRLFNKQTAPQPRLGEANLAQSTKFASFMSHLGDLTPKRPAELPGPVNHSPKTAQQGIKALQTLQELLQKANSDQQITYLFPEFEGAELTMPAKNFPQWVASVIDKFPGGETAQLVGTIHKSQSNTAHTSLNLSERQKSIVGGARSTSLPSTRFRPSKGGGETFQGSRFEGYPGETKTEEEDNKI